MNPPPNMVRAARSPAVAKSTRRERIDENARILDSTLTSEDMTPARVAAAVLEQPIGMADGNGTLFEQMWRAWGARLSSRKDLSPAAIEDFGNLMWRDDFVVSVSRDFVRSCATPLLVLSGTDRDHPTATGREIAALAPNGQLVEPWNDTQQSVDRAVVAVHRFLEAHTPGQFPK